MAPTLHIFDLDGTLAETWKTELLPGVVTRVSKLQGHLAVATNQAGVAWNAIEGAPYPRPAQVGRRLAGVAAALPRLEEALWLVAIGDERVSLPPQRWRGLAAGVTQAASPLWVRTSGDPAWRKPRPGMLIAACQAFDMAPGEALFIGDHDVDAQAAQAAGVGFITADRYFDRA